MEKVGPVLGQTWNLLNKPSESARVEELVVCPNCEGHGELLLLDSVTMRTSRMLCNVCFGERLVEKKVEWTN